MVLPLFGILIILDLVGFSSVLNIDAPTAKHTRTKLSEKLTNVGVLVSNLNLYYTSTKSWRGYIFTAVCLSMCVCPALFVNKIPAERIN